VLIYRCDICGKDISDGSFPTFYGNVTIKSSGGYPSSPNKFIELMHTHECCRMDLLHEIGKAVERLRNPNNEPNTMGEAVEHTDASTAGT
jgi:hypothetical protein